MALVLSDRVKVRSVSTGTGTFVLGNTVQGFQDFSAIGDGNETYYGIIDNLGNWEIGKGTYTAAGNLLSRDEVVESSNSGNLVDFASGSKNVFCTFPSSLASSIAGFVTNNYSGEFVGNVRGSVFADNSTLLVDGTNGSIPYSVITGIPTSLAGLTGLQFSGGVSITEFSVDGTLADDSDNAVPTEKAVKTYVDTAIASFDSVGNFTLGSSTIDTDDSSAINITPSVIMNSDLTVENDLTVNNLLTVSRLNVLENIESSGTGTPELFSETDILITAGISNRVEITQTPLKLASFSIGERDALSAETGDVIFNTTANVFQGYTGAIWKTLETVTGNIEFSGTTITSDDSSGITFVPHVTLSSGLVVGDSIIPSSSVSFDLGSDTNRFRDLYLSGSTIDLGGTKLSRDVEGNVSFNDAVTNSPKKIVVSEIEIGSGEEKIRIRRDNNSGAVKIESLAPNGEVADSTNDSEFRSITMTGTLYGPSSFVIDPATHDDDTGTVVIAGNLRVDGTTTTVNSTTVEVGDKNLVLGAGAEVDTDNNGAGITVSRPDSTDVSITWDETLDRWTVGSQSLAADTFIGNVTGDVSGNAGSVTNGVYTTGSYSDPSWITSLAASKVGLGNVTNESKATMFTSPTFTGVTTLPKIQEPWASLSSATGVVIHDCAASHVFRHTSISANFTANFTNLNLSSGHGTNIILLLVQGTTPRICNAVQIGGVSQTILWQGSSLPSGTANKTDLITFSIINNSGTYTVLGSLISYGAV